MSSAFSLSRRVRAVVAASAALYVLSAPVTYASASTSDASNATAAAQAIATAQRQAATHLPGANDWNCKPSATHPYPVVLVHGTLSPAAIVWSTIAPALKQDGYCVFALTYGTMIHVPLIGGLLPGAAHIDSSAGELATFVDGVLAATGADKVDVIGVSQGGMMPRQYMRFHGGAAKVHLLFGIAPTNHGTTALGLVKVADALPILADIVGIACPACIEQLSDSPFITRLNQGGDTLPGVRYVVVATKLDGVATPFDQSSFLRDANPNVTNITLQNLCPANLDIHLTIVWDPLVLRLVRNALDPNHAIAPMCGH